MKTSFSIQNDFIKLHNKWGLGIIFYIFAFLGFCVSLIALPVFIALLMQADASLFARFIALFVLILGILFFWTGLRSPAKGYREEVTFDVQKGIVNIECKRQSQRIIQIKTEAISSLFITQRSLNRNERHNTNKAWLCYLILSDRSSFWIATFRKQPEVDEFSKTLASLMHIEATNTLETGFEIYEESTPINIMQGYPENFLDSGYQDHRPYYQLKKPKPGFGGYFIGSLVFLLFTGAPLAIITAESNQTLGSSIFLIFASFFALIWYGVLVTIFLISTRKTRFVISGLKVQLEIRFLLPFLNKTFILDASNTHCILIHRIHEGHFLLGAHLRPNAQLKPGIFYKSILASSPHSLAYDYRNPDIFMLQEVTGWNHPKKGPLLEDLLKLKSHLRL